MDLDELLKLAAKPLPKKKEQRAANLTERFLNHHSQIKPGNQLVSAKYLFWLAKRWNDKLPIDRRWFFRWMPKYFKRKEYKEGTYYYLDLQSLSLTQEEINKYVKQRKKQKRKATKVNEEPGVKSEPNDQG